MVKNAFVRLVNRTNNKELARYNLSGAEYSGMTGMILAEVYRHNDDWKMAAVGNGFKVANPGRYCQTLHLIEVILIY